MFYERFLRPILFKMDAEDAHERVTMLLGALQSIPGGPRALAWSLGKPTGDLGVELFGIRFPNPVGLAAGFDKDCRLPKILPSLGFGFLELGSVTLKAQPGNPKPRLTRLPECHALINRMGFNSAGAKSCSANLKALGNASLPIGINLGLNADCPPQDAPQNYAQTFQILEPYGDYFALNISSPNTKALKGLQEPKALEKVLWAVQALNKSSKPVLVKISPDLDDAELAAILEVVKSQASGVIAANTTTLRDDLPSRYAQLPGGLSGAPLEARSTNLIRKIFNRSGGKLPIIGTGGVSTGGQAFEKIAAGASLVELYTALIYEGPRLVPRLLKELAKILEERGFKTPLEAVGSAAGA